MKTGTMTTLSFVVGVVMMMTTMMVASTEGLQSSLSDN
jgi:hypothetical protein